jgi:hypothetical protein
MMPRHARLLPPLESEITRDSILRQGKHPLDHSSFAVREEAFSLLDKGLEVCLPTWAHPLSTRFLRLMVCAYVLHDPAYNTQPLIDF